MRRALVGLFVVALVLASPASQPSADSTAIDGTTMVDFSKPPNFKVGSWVHYHAVSGSALGYHGDYELWLLIAGEEEFWGDRCFWLETWTLDRGGDTVATAALISYSAFGDSASLRHPAWFQRKTVTGLAEDGSPDVNIPQRDRGDFKIGASGRGHRPPEQEGTNDRGFDTLAVDTCRLPSGNFRGPVAREINHIVMEVMRGDSTVHYDRTETRLRKLDDRIPINRMAREDITDVQQNHVWATGESNKVFARTLEDARGATVLIDYGDHGLPSRVVTLIPRRASSKMVRLVSPATGPATSPTPKTRGTSSRGGRTR